MVEYRYWPHKYNTDFLFLKCAMLYALNAVINLVLLLCYMEINNIEAMEATRVYSLAFAYPAATVLCYLAYVWFRVFRNHSKWKKERDTLMERKAAEKAAYDLDNSRKLSLNFVKSLRKQYD